MHDPIVFDGALGTLKPTGKRGEYEWYPLPAPIADDAELELEDDTAAVE